MMRFVATIGVLLPLANGFAPMQILPSTPTGNRQVVRLQKDNSDARLSDAKLSDATMAQLQNDYQDLKEAFHYQANYFKHMAAGAEDGFEVTEDSLQHTAYLAHLKRFEMEKAAQLATQNHERALQELDTARKEWFQWNEDKIIQDFEYELAQSEEIRTRNEEHHALQLVNLLEKSEWDLKAALKELGQNYDSSVEEELREHHDAFLHTFKSRLIDNDLYFRNASM